MSDLGERHQAVRHLLDAAAAAAERGEAASALAMVEAAAVIDPDEPTVAAALARGRAGVSSEEAPTGMRRRLTVMFVDLVGSTEMATSLDPEDTREILHAFHEVCANVVRRHDGRIVHLMGDGALVTFGFPRAHEDDAERAILSALAIVEGVRRLRSPATATNWELKVRVGIHTGLTVVEYLSDNSWAMPGEIYGETPNLASRVQTAAEPGTVVISDSTLAVVGDRVDVDPLGAHSLKGIDREVELFRVRSVRDPSRAEDEDEAADVVGRVAERAALDDACEAACTSGAYVVVCGEPGIGKSHMLRYGRDRMRTAGGRSMVLRCSALHSNTPLQPVVQFVRAQLDEADGNDPLDRLGGLARSAGLNDEDHLYLLAQMCSVPWPADRPSPDLLPEQARERTLAMLTTWIDSLSDEGPLLLAVEDLHWADPSTVDVLGRLVTREQSRPILVLLTTRSTSDTAPGVPDTVIELDPLGEAASDALVDALTGGSLDSSTRALITERGDGVPLYMRELARMLNEQAADAYGRALTVPPTLNDLLVARLDSFPHARPLLDALSVLGRPAPTTLLEVLTGRLNGDLQADLEDLERSGVLRVSSSPRHYDFHHSLLRDTAYDVQMLSDRRRLHLRVAGALDVDPTAEVRVDQALELARHYEMGGEISRAVTLWLQAGVGQSGVAAHVEAITTFELVIQHLAELGAEADAVELQARNGLAASLLAARGYTAPEVAEAYGRVRDLSAARDARLELLSLYGLWSYYHMTGNAQTSVELAGTLHERALASNDDQDELAASAVLGYQLMHVGRLAEAVPLLEVGRRWQADEPLWPHHAGIGAGVNLAMTQWVLGDFARARCSIDDAVAAADAMVGPTAHFTRAYANLWGAVVHNVAGRHQAAADHANRVIQVSTEFGFPTWLGAGMTELKIAESMVGDEDAIPVLEFCLQAWRDAGATTGLTQSGLGLALAYRTVGRSEAALAAIDQALTDARANDERYLEPELLRVRGELLSLLQPGSTEGLAALHSAVTSARSSGSRGLELMALVSLECRHRDRDDVPTAVPDIDRLLAALDPTGTDPEPCLVRAREFARRTVP